jgi:ABC-type glycerol-3-phosphate transport system substrate-binding protein
MKKTIISVLAIMLAALLMAPLAIGKTVTVTAANGTSHTQTVHVGNSTITVTATTSR